MAILTDEWRDLRPNEQETLIGIGVCGPSSGIKLHRAIREDPAEDTTKGSTSRALGLLKDKGLIEREEAEDNRAKIASLTPQGKVLLDRNVVEVADRIAAE